MINKVHPEPDPIITDNSLSAATSQLTDTSAQLLAEQQASANTIEELTAPRQKEGLVEMDLAKNLNPDSTTPDVPLSDLLTEIKPDSTKAHLK